MVKIVIFRTCFYIFFTFSSRLIFNYYQLHFMHLMSINVVIVLKTVFCI